MASDEIVERIVKLLRQAASSDGTPEGDNAAARAGEIARRLMEKYDVQVILGDIPPEEMPRAREAGEDFGTFDAREIWMEEIVHCIGWLYDLAPVWYCTDKGRIGLIVFDAHGDAERLKDALDVFDTINRLVLFQPMPRYLLHNIEFERAKRIYRAGMAHSITTRLSRIGQLPRVAMPELPTDDDTVALVPIRVHRRPRHAFVDSTMDVPIQGGPEEWAQGAEATLFAYGVRTGQFLPIPTPEVRRGG